MNILSFAGILFLLSNLYPGKYSLEIPFYTHAPEIDGILENIWQNALKIEDLVESQPEVGKVPPVKTEILLGYDLEALYIAFICYDDMSKVRVHNAKKDACFGDDIVGLYIDCFRNREMAYVFETNPLGCQIDGKSGQEIWEQHSDFEWQSKGKSYADHWVVEIKIPFSTLTFPKEKNQIWRVQFFRVRPRKDLELYYWFPMGNDFSHTLDHMGEIKFSLEKGHLLSPFIYPYFLISRTNLEDSTYWNHRMGMTIDLGLSNNSHILLTAVPDHKEIETDYPIISINRKTAVGYPEKRPFFKKADEIFDFPFYAFYSRSINDPYVAVKFFSKGERMDMGGISAYNRNSSWIVPVGEYSSMIIGDLNSLINIFTIGWKVREGAHVKSIVCQRLTQGNVENGDQLVGGVDGNLRISKELEIYGAILGSHTKEVIDTSLMFYSYLPDSFDNRFSTFFDGENFFGLAYRGGLTFSNPHFYADIYSEHVSPTFRDQNGYIAVNNRRSYSLNSYTRFYFHRLGIKEMKLGIYGSLNNTYRNKFLYSSISPYISFSLPFQINLQLSYDKEKEMFQERVFEKHLLSTTIETSPHSWVSLNSRFSLGKGINYYGNPPDLADFSSVSAGITFSPLKTFLLNVSYNRERMANVYDLYTLWLNTQISFRSIFFRWIGYYDEQQKMYYFFPLFSFEYKHYGHIYIGGSLTLPKDAKGFEYCQIYLKTSFTINGGCSKSKRRFY